MPCIRDRIYHELTTEKVIYNYCNTSTKVKPSQSLSVAGINDNDLSSNCDFDVTQKLQEKGKEDQ